MVVVPETFVNVVLSGSSTSLILSGIDDTILAMWLSKIVVDGIIAYSFLIFLSAFKVMKVSTSRSCLKQYMADLIVKKLHICVELLLKS